MKTQILILITLILFVIIIFTRADFAQEAGKLYEKALFQEESDGNLQKAITLYEKIVKEYGNETEIAAKAQLHIGFCYCITWIQVRFKSLGLNGSCLC